jgi:exopolysaccharide biosynthesis protein
VASDTSASKFKVKNPRSAIGYYEPGHYCFIVVDGRQNGYSDGMTLDELAQTLRSSAAKRPTISTEAQRDDGV